jgi:hypothetical protein
VVAASACDGQESVELAEEGKKKKKLNNIIEQKTEGRNG